MCRKKCVSWKDLCALKFYYKPVRSVANRTIIRIPVNEACGNPKSIYTTFPRGKPVAVGWARLAVFSVALRKI